MSDGFLVKTLIVIVASLAAVGALARLRLPPILGYLLAGFAIGPHGVGILAVSPETDFLAKLGVIMLTFMVGLEFPLRSLLQTRRDVLGAGSLQVSLVTSAVAAAAHVLFGVQVVQALLLGGAAAMSSTALAVKQIVDQGETGRRHGRMAVAILLFQDWAMIPFLVTIGIWSRGHAPEVSQIVTQLAIASFVLSSATIICRPIFRGMLTAVARVRSAELFLLAALMLALGAAYAARLVGLAEPTGAFLAGMVVGESDFRHRIEDDIRPFRDVLVGLFFVTVGMEVDPSTAVAAPLAVLAWALALLPCKAMLNILAGKILRWPTAVAVRSGVILAHGGEFGLLLLTQAIQSGAIQPVVGHPALLAITISMGFAPVLIQRNEKISRLIQNVNERSKIRSEDIADQRERSSLNDHVLLCGCGRVGHLVAVVLEAANVPYIAIESDFVRFRKAKEQGHNVVYGDATRISVLQAAGVARASVVAVTFDQRPAVERILHIAQQQNATIATIVSAADDRELAGIVSAGASTVFPENFAAGLGLAHQVLRLAGLDQQEASNAITQVRTVLSPELSERVGI